LISQGLNEIRTELGIFVTYTIWSRATPKTLVHGPPRRRIAGFQPTEQVWTSRTLHDLHLFLVITVFGCSNRIISSNVNRQSRFGSARRSQVPVNSLESLLLQPGKSPAEHISTIAGRVFVSPIECAARLLMACAVSSCSCEHLLSLETSAYV
jgi:hypothetical protein